MHRLHIMAKQSDFITLQVHYHWLLVEGANANIPQVPLTPCTQPLEP